MRAWIGRPAGWADPYQDHACVHACRPLEKELGMQISISSARLAWPGYKLLAISLSALLDWLYKWTVEA